MLQQDAPKDYVIATGEQYSVRQAVEAAGSHLGIELTWDGTGESEVGVVARSELAELKQGTPIVRIDPRYYRPTEVDTLLGDASLAKRELGWKPKIAFNELIEEMALSSTLR